MDRRSEGKQPTTRAERAKARRRAQGRRNTAEWRRRKREEAARAAAAAAKPEPVMKDPIWADPPEAPRQTAPGASGSAAAGTRYDPRIEVDKDGNVIVADPAGEAQQEPNDDPKPATRYIRRAARGPKPEEPVPLARAFDPRTGRRRVRIVHSDGRVVEGEVDGSGSGGIPDLDWGNF